MQIEAGGHQGSGRRDMARGRVKQRRASGRALLGAVLVLCALAAPSGASAQTVEAFDLAFKDWMRRHRVAQGVLAVSHGGRLALVRGYGGLDPEASLPLASLAKPITGACVATLLRDRKLTLDTKLGDVLDPFFRRHGDPADMRVRMITIEQLLTHRSGFSRHANPDPASGAALLAHLRAYGGAQPHLNEALARALRYRLTRAPGRAYEYVNVNYLILGAVIEQASGRTYEEYCRTTLLRPLGVHGARLSDKWAALSSYGGWSLSGAEYLAFLAAFDRDSKMIDAATQRWMLTPAGKQIDGDSAYTLGMVVSRDGAGANFVHTGLWAHTQIDVPGGPLFGSLATLAVKRADGAAWFAFMSPQPSKPVRADLYRALWDAANRVKAWPQHDLFARYGVGKEPAPAVVPVATPLKTGDAGKLGDAPARN